MEASDHEWARFTGLLRIYVTRRVGADQVDDLVGDILLRLVKHRDQFINANNPIAWMYRVAGNAVTDHYRRRGLEQHAHIADYPSDYPSLIEEQAIEGDNHSEPLQELSGCLIPFIETLPPRYREAIKLVDVDGTPQVEAAKQLGLSGSGLKSRVQRGRKQLRQLFLNCCEIEFGKTSGIADWSPRKSPQTPCDDLCAETKIENFQHVGRTR